MTQGYQVSDIEKIVLAQSNGVPVTVKDVAKVYVGYMPRLGKAGRDNEDDVVAAIVVMNRTLHTNDVVARIKAEVDKINSDGTLPPGVKLVPFYDRTILVSVTTHTVLHNLIFGCLLVFLIQWIFLGDLRSAIIVGINIPFALFFSVIILVLRGEDANLLSVGAVDFGIIVDSAVILVENIFRNFQAQPEEGERAAAGSLRRSMGRRSDRSPATRRANWTDRLRLILVSALQVDKAIFFSTAITVAAFVPLFTMQGVEGQIFGPMARTYGYALLGALIATFTITPVLASYLLPDQVKEAETIVVRALRRIYTPMLQLVAVAPKDHGRRSASVSAGHWPAGRRASAREFLPALEEGNLWIRASMPPTISLEAGMPIVDKIRRILLRHPEVITVVSQHGRPDNGSDAAGFTNAEFFVPLKPFDEWPPGMTKEKLIKDLQSEFSTSLPGSVSISRNTSRTTSRRACPGSKAPIRSRSSAAIWRSWSSSPTR